MSIAAFDSRDRSSMLRARQHRPKWSTTLRPVFLGVLLVAAGSQLWNRLQRGSPAESPAREPAAAPVPSPGQASSAPVDENAMPLYLARASALRREVRQTGEVSYFQVVQAAYPPGRISPQVLARKSAYRKRTAASIPYLADYATMREVSTVQEAEKVSYPLAFRRKADGVFFAFENRITLARSARDSALYHEAGHALQKRDFLGPIFEDFAESAEDERRIDGNEAEMLRYLSDLKELEISLQDLNRFHAHLVNGRPVMTPRDAIRALTAFGVIQTWDEAQAAYAIAGKKLTRADFLDAWRNPYSHRFVRMLFPDAHRLVRLREVALKTDSPLWRSLLHYLIFAAPGHL
jgi:hypothetical protein